MFYILAIMFFGIGLGFHLIAKAAGCEMQKLQHPHRGANQPVKDIVTGRVYITTQNHGYAIDEASLEGTGLVADQININDKSVEGTRHKDLPIITCQYVPGESSDTAFVYEDFTKMMEARK